MISYALDLCQCSVLKKTAIQALLNSKYDQAMNALFKVSPSTMNDAFLTVLKQRIRMETSGFAQCHRLLQNQVNHHIY